MKTNVITLLTLISCFSFKLCYSIESKDSLVVNKVFNGILYHSHSDTIGTEYSLLIEIKKGEYNYSLITKNNDTTKWVHNFDSIQKDTNIKFSYKILEVDSIHYKLYRLYHDDPNFIDDEICFFYLENHKPILLTKSGFRQSTMFIVDSLDRKIINEIGTKHVSFYWGYD